MRIKQYLLPVLWGLLTSGLIISSGCSSEVVDTPVNEDIEVPSSVIEDVTAQEAYALIEENLDNPDFIIIDIRTPEEYDEGHLEGARNIDFYEPDFAEQIDILDKDNSYLVYCRSGTRSGNSLPVFEEKGFLKIYHMDGGILEWTAEELPLVK
ncbi:rhodanese-like domain-containing protein [Chloroflexota bacterium]